MTESTIWSDKVTLIVLTVFLYCREDGELEDGEIDDEGIGIEEENKEAPEVNEDKEKEKEKEKEREKTKDKEEKTHRHSRKRYKKAREKRRSKRRRRDRQKVNCYYRCYYKLISHTASAIRALMWTANVKLTLIICVSLFPLPFPQHHSPSSSSTSDSYDSDYGKPERPKSRKSQGSSRESDCQTSQVITSQLACWCLIFLLIFGCDIFLFDCGLFSTEGIQRAAMVTHRSLRHIRAVTLTNTATTVMTSMITTKKRMITMMTCLSISQPPQVRERAAMLKTRWREEAWGGWNNSSVWKCSDTFLNKLIQWMINNETQLVNVTHEYHECSVWWFVFSWAEGKR